MFPQASWRRSLRSRTGKVRRLTGLKLCFGDYYLPAGIVNLYNPPSHGLSISVFSDPDWPLWPPCRSCLSPPGCAEQATSGYIWPGEKGSKPERSGEFGKRDPLIGSVLCFGTTLIRVDSLLLSFQAASWPLTSPNTVWDDKVQNL